MSKEVLTSQVFCAVLERLEAEEAGIMHDMTQSHKALLRGASDAEMDRAREIDARWDACRAQRYHLATNVVIQGVQA